MLALRRGTFDCRRGLQKDVSREGLDDVSMLTPVQTAVRAIERGVPFRSVNGKGQLRVLSVDPLGVVLQLGASRRIASVPWTAMETAVEFLRWGQPVELRSRFAVPDYQTSLSHVVRPWTRYSAAAFWIAAVLREAGIVVLSGPRWAAELSDRGDSMDRPELRLLPESAGRCAAGLCAQGL